jgi:hypothetical protein
MDGIDFSVQQVGQLYFYNYLKKKISLIFLNFYLSITYLDIHVLININNILVLKLFFFVMFNWYKTNPQGLGFTTTYAISAYHNQRCEFEPRSWRGVLDSTSSDKVCQ